VAKQRMMMIISAAAAALAVTGGLAAPALAARAATVRPGFTSGKTYRVEQQDNGSAVCLDASFEFSVCQTSGDPDDPPALQKWVIDSTGKSTYKLWNHAGTNDCLDVKEFTAPCSPAGSSQKWSFAAAGTGTYHIEHRASGGSMCLDEFWTFKACSSGDAQQIWSLKPVS
jgi:hypothetical protein